MEEISREKITWVRKIEKRINKNLFFICSVITIITLIFYLLTFFTRGAFPPSKIELFYIGILILYSFHKELVRWLGEKEVERQGEWFVYIWVIVTLILYIINFLTKDYFLYSPQNVPLDNLRQITITTLEVCGIFILTRLSKILNTIQHLKKL